MNIVVIYHTKTGSTRKFAELIVKNLSDRQHTVELIELRAEGEVQPHAGNVNIVNLPDCSSYDAVLIGGPVWGFTATPVVIASLKQMRGLSGKKVLPFVTMGFPLRLMGGKKTVALMGKLLVDAGAEVMPGVIVPKMCHNFHDLIEKESARIAGKF
jgi:flavodoxin